MKTKLLSLLLTITLMVGLLPVTMVSAETTATTAPTTKAITPATTAPTDATNPNFDTVSLSVKLCENTATEDYAVTLTATKGGKAVYATTSDSGTPILVTGSTAPKNKYIKFEYPQNGLPTITFMNARLRSTGNALDLSAFDAPVKIVIAGDSTIESTGKNGIYRESYGDITIVGPQKLTMNCYNSAIAFGADPYANSLTLKDLKLKATAYANVDGHTLQIPAGNLTIDKCNIELVNRAGVCVYLGFGSISGYGNATISGSVFSATSQNTAVKLAGNLSILDSNAQFSSDTQALLCGRNLSANGSTLYMIGRSQTKETVDVRGDFTLHTSNAEITGTRFAIFSSTTLPRTFGECTVIAGITKETTSSFSESLVSAYQYYYAENLEQSTEPTTPTASETTPTGTDPTGTAPTGTAPTETEPAYLFTEPTAEPTETPTTSATSAASTYPTLSSPTPPVNNTAKKSGIIFWLLAALMVLGACGAAVSAIMMFRRSAEEDAEDELDEDYKEIPTEEVEEETKESLWEKIKKFFVRKREDNIFEEDVSEETQEISDAEAEDETKKSPWVKIKTFFVRKPKEDPEEETAKDPEEELMKEILEEPLPVVDEDELEAILKEFHEEPVAASEEAIIEESEEEVVEEPEEATEESEEVIEETEEETSEEPAEDTAEDPQEVIEETSAEDAAEKPKKFSMKKLKNFFIKIIEETTADDFEEAVEEDTEN